MEQSHSLGDSKVARRFSITFTNLEQ